MLLQIMYKCQITLEYYIEYIKIESLEIKIIQGQLYYLHHDSTLSHQGPQKQCNQPPTQTQPGHLGLQAQMKLYYIHGLK